MKKNTKKIPVIICTDKRGVIFGYTSSDKMPAVTLENARFCIYWHAGGIGSLAASGPVSGKDRVGAVIPKASFPDVHAVFYPTQEAVSAWESIPVYVG